MNPRLFRLLTWGTCALLLACAPLSQQTATIQARLNVQGFKTQAAPATTADVDHYTYQLRDNGTNALIASYQSSATSLTFTGVPGGTFKLTAEAFSSHSETISITVGGAQTSSNTVTVSGGGVSYSSGSALAATLDLLPGDGDTVAGQVNFTGDEGNLDHFTYDLIRTSDQSVAATFSSLLTDFLFNEIDSGTYRLRGEAFDDGSSSISHQTLSSNTVTVSPSGVTYSSGTHLALTLSPLNPDTWTTGYADIPGGLQGVGVAAIDGILYMAGGMDNVATNTDQLLAYDPSSDTWSAKASMPGTIDNSATVAANGKLYVIGGYAGAAQNQTWEYNPATDSWAWKASMPAWLGNAGIAELDGKIYTVAGYPGSSPYSQAVNMYDPATNTWTNKADYPLQVFGLAVAAVNGKIYGFGGFNGTFGIGDTYEYDPIGNTWTAKTAMPTWRCQMQAVAYSGKIYVIGGSTDAVEIYDPATDSWTAGAAMPDTRQRFGMALIDSFIYVAGGDIGISYPTSVYRYEP